MKLFYDHLIDRSDLEQLLEKKAKNSAEKEKLLKLLDEIVHKTVLDAILIHLDERHHEEFLEIIHKEPHNESILIYLREKAHPEIEEKIKREVEKLTTKIISDLNS